LTEQEIINTARACYKEGARHALAHCCVTHLTSPELLKRYHSLAAKYFEIDSLDLDMSIGDCAGGFELTQTSQTLSLRLVNPDFAGLLEPTFAEGYRLGARQALVLCMMPNRNAKRKDDQQKKQSLDEEYTAIGEKHFGLDDKAFLDCMLLAAGRKVTPEERELMCEGARKLVEAVDRSKSGREREPMH